MRRQSTLTASPTMIGAVTVLIVILAVFLAYNANNGLPFVPTYRLTAQVPDANTLVPGNEVRVGGVRVGVVDAVEPVQHADGTVTADLSLQLDEQIEPLPRDSRIMVRARSSLGLKYLEIRRGTSDEGFPEGSRIPLSAAHREPVDIDQVLSTFNEPTREAIQDNLFEFGNALAGRGPQLNAALGDLAPLLGPLERVMENLSAPETQLGRFFDALGATAAEVAPVAETQAQMFASLDTTFAALASVARPYIQATISEAPPTLAVSTRALPRIRPFLRHSALFFDELRPGIDALEANAPAIASALEKGAPVLADAPAFNRRLPPATQALRDLNDDNGARRGIDRLRETFRLLDPTLSFLTPSQTVCNYPTILLRNLASVVGQGDGAGSTWQRFIVFQPPEGANNEGSPSSGPASGAGGDPDNFLHANVYPNTAAPGQVRECEAANEPYLGGQQVIGNVPGNQGTATELQP